MEPVEAPAVTNSSPSELPAAKSKRTGDIPTSAYNAEIERRGKQEPIVKSRLLPIEERFEAIASALRRSGLAVNITVDAKEEQLKLVMPMVHDLRYDDPLQMILELQDLELGDVVALGLANDKIYYAPRAAPNIYHDPLKREPFAKIREDEQKQMLAFAKKHKNNMPLRVTMLETKVSRLCGLEETIERADHAIRQLLKTKTENNYEDLVAALREQVEDVRQYTVKVPSLEARLALLERATLQAAADKGKEP